MEGGDPAAPSKRQEQVSHILQDKMEMRVQNEYRCPRSGYSIDVLVREHEKQAGVAARTWALEYDGGSHFLEPCGSPTGRTILKRRHLRQLGYALVSIPDTDWSALNGREVAYLQGKLEASTREQATQATCPCDSPLPAASATAESSSARATPEVGKAGGEKKALSTPMAAVAPSPSPSAKKAYTPPLSAPAPTRSAPEKSIVKKTKAEEVRSAKHEAEEVKPAKKDGVMAANKEEEDHCPAPAAAKACTVCGVHKPKRDFSKKQWGLTTRKCSKCVMALDESSQQAAKVDQAPNPEARLYRLYKMAWAIGLLAAFLGLMYDGGLIFLPPLITKL